MKNFAVVGLIFWSVFQVTPAVAEYDFVIGFENCKTVAAPLAHDKQVKVVEGDESAFACSRKQRAVKCRMQLGTGSEKQFKEQVFELGADLPPILSFQSKDFGDFIMINTTERTAAVVTRMVGTSFIASKVCNGVYVTADEIKRAKEAKKTQQ